MDDNERRILARVVKTLHEAHDEIATIASRELESSKGDGQQKTDVHLGHVLTDAAEVIETTANTVEEAVRFDGEQEKP